MSYTVIYIPSAEATLARLYLNTLPNSLERKQLSTVADQLDQLLKNDPLKTGSAFENRRLYFLSPIAVIFDVYPEDRLVKVKKIWKHAA